MARHAGPIFIKWVCKKCGHKLGSYPVGATVTCPKCGKTYVVKE